MEENKNVENNVELIDEQLEELAGGQGQVIAVKCTKCGKVHFPGCTGVAINCDCGNSIIVW